MMTAVVGLFAMTSCKKCGECVGGNGTSSGEVCKDDAGQLGYDVAKSACESSGGTWED